MIFGEISSSRSRLVGQHLKRREQRLRRQGQLVLRGHIGKRRKSERNTQQAGNSRPQHERPDAALRAFEDLLTRILPPKFFVISVDQFLTNPPQADAS